MTIFETADPDHWYKPTLPPSTIKAGIHADDLGYINEANYLSIAPFHYPYFKFFTLTIIHVFTK